MSPDDPIDLALAALREDLDRLTDRVNVLSVRVRHTSGMVDALAKQAAGLMILLAALAVVLMLAMAVLIKLLG